jgi:hypothetical protein
MARVKRQDSTLPDFLWTRFKDLPNTSEAESRAYALELVRRLRLVAPHIPVAERDRVNRLLDEVEVSALAIN